MSAGRRILLVAVVVAVLASVIVIGCAAQSPSGPGTPGASNALPTQVRPSQALPTGPVLPTPAPGATAAAPIVPVPSGPMSLPIPNAASYGAPDWVQAGTRMTYYGAAASVVGSGYTYVEDPNGEWEDPKTQKRYHRTDQGDQPQDMPSAAGEAYTQTDVLAIEPGNVVLAVTMYPIDLMTRQFGILPLGGYNGQNAAVNGAWVHPSLLQDLVTSGYEDQMILRGPFALAGVQYEGVSFLYRGPGSWQDSTYDAATGVLLATNTRVEGQPSPVHGPFDDPQGNVQVSYTRLVNVRQVSVPGLGAPVPSWVGQGRTLAYTGTVLIVNPMDPSARFSYPVETTVTFDLVGPTWATFSSHSVIDYGQYQQPTDSTGTTGATGTYWYDPGSLASFQAGQFLDQDPATGAQVTVQSANPGGIVSLLTEMNGASLLLGYDSASGALMSMETTNTTTGITLQIQLVSG